MTDLLGNGEGHTLLILTDSESRLIRAALERDAKSHGAELPTAAFNRGIQRGTEKLKADFAARQKAKK